MRIIIKAIILDFDGVILESADIKIATFRELFKEYPEHINAIVDYHIENGGISRYVKFIYIYKNMLKQPLDDNKLNELGKKFSEITFQKTLGCPFVHGVQNFLENYSKRMPLFIVSGTPGEELQLIIRQRGLSNYFKDIYGLPAIKPEAILQILDKEGLDKDEVLFVGDAISDYKDAKQAGIPFVGRFDGAEESNPFIRLGVPIVRDFYEFKILLQKREGI